jgi:hypothetical protein
MVALPLLLLGTILLSGTKSIAQNSSIIAQQTPAEKEAKTKQLINQLVDSCVQFLITSDNYQSANLLIEEVRNKKSSYPEVLGMCLDKIKSGKLRP